MTQLAHEVVLFPLQVAFAILFLYSILGWSALVGLGVMVMLFPLPGLVAKKMQHVQVERMKIVSINVANEKITLTSTEILYPRPTQGYSLLQKVRFKYLYEHPHSK